MIKVNDKGFSLVELIIVVAIMAILITVLVPQYIKYVERSRNATDMQNARAVATAIETYAIDPNNASPHWPAEDHWEFVTAFAVNDTADRPDNFHGGSYGGARNGDTRVDDYAWYAMQDAGLIQPSGRPVGIRAQSKNAWTTWTVGYRYDGSGGIIIRFAETADVIESGGSDDFTKAMAGK